MTRTSPLPRLARRPAARKPSPRRRPLLEPLEDRSLLSGSPPTVLISGPAQVGESPYGPYTLNLTAVDPEGDPVTEWTIDWGDGSVETLPGNPGIATHNYANGPVVRNVTASAVVGGETFDAHVGEVAGTFMDTFVQPGSGGIDHPGFLEFGRDDNGDGVGDLYVGNTDTSIVNVYNGETGAWLRTLMTPADGLFRTWDLAFGPDGDLFVSGDSSSNVLRYDFATNSVSTFIPVVSGNSPRALAFGPDANGDSIGDLYVSYEGYVSRYDPVTGQFIDVFLTGLRFDAMVFGPDGHLYATNATNRVLRYNGTTGASMGDFIPAGAGGLNTAEGLTFGPDGDLYVASYGNDRVLHFDGATGAFMGAITGGGLDDPADVVFGNDGHLLVSSWLTKSILRYAGPLTTTAATSLPVTVLDAVTATYSSSPNAAIPDNSGYSSWSIDVLDPGPLLDVDVTLNITHPNVGDLDVLLISPAGSTRRLFYRVGGSGDNFTGTIIDDEAAISITNGTAPFTGRFRQGPPLAGSAIPPGPLSDFDGEQGNGTWTLQISDRAKKNTGTLNSWSVTTTRGVGPSGLEPDTLVIGDAKVIEGDLGSLTTEFTVTLSTPRAAPFTVTYATANGTATAGSDYTATSGSVTFQPGQMTKRFSVPILGNTTVEPRSETFLVNLTAAGVSPSSDLQAVGTILDNDTTATPSINYTSFSATTGLNLVGSAQRVQNKLRLTPATGDQAGGAWYTTQQVVADGFKTTFQFKMPGGSDGLAFVIQNSPGGTGALGGAGGEVGYGGIANSLAIEFDTWHNGGGSGEPNHNHVAVHTAGTAANSAGAAYSLATAVPPFVLDNNATHTARVDYISGVLQVYLDGAAAPLLKVNVDLATILNLAPGGKAWVGFTAATGGGYYQTHEIVTWQFTPLPAALLAGGAPAVGRARAGTLRPTDLQPLVGEAISRWRAAGADPSALAGVKVGIANLGGAYLGLASGNTIWLDDNAAGWGWFVDPTPADDREFTTPGNQGEQGRMDLLTVLMHEMGHVLGLGHDDHGAMQEALAPGQRHATVDHAFADWAGLAAEAAALERRPSRR